MTYDVVVADPPWPYYGTTTGWGDAAKFYPLMADDEIYNLPIRDWMNPRSILFLWVTCPKLDLAMHAIERWRLKYRGVAFVWVKTKQDGTPIGAQGVRPSITKPLTELVLAASQTALGRPLSLSDESVCQTVFAPKGAHSAKPEAVQERIERMYPLCSKMELFARGRGRPGWDVWGDEAIA